MQHKVACIQLNTTENIEQNWNILENLIRDAARQGAKLVVTPENSLFLGSQFHKLEIAQDIDGDWGKMFSVLAKELGIYLLIGSIAERQAPSCLASEKCFNTTLFYDPKGERIAVYRKIHLFDVDIPNGITIRESDFVVAGTELVVVDIGWTKLGLSICYDLRFPEMYRKLVEMGAEMIVVPSAFTHPTGKDHWHTLLKGRAIDNQVFILAPNQYGIHDKKGKRHSYGHSLIIDPWGIILAEKQEGIGIIFADIQIDRVYQIRRSIPLSEHRVY